MVRTNDLTERVIPFVEPDESVVGTLRVFRGPRPGAEALALVVNVPVFAFFPTSIVATLAICVVTTAVVIMAIQALRRYVLCAVTDQGVLLLDCGHFPGRWAPRSLLRRDTWAAFGTPAAPVDSRLRIGPATYWMRSADQSEARRLARWIAAQD